jgi:LmbE family N-acetylglucosaminyl deacetylase
MDAHKLTLLAVLAHPDDESFGMGGTLALYAERGVSVHLVCATRGEAGEINPKHLQGFSSAAELRSAELRCAAGILGLDGVHFLDYRDSGMAGSADNAHPNSLVKAPLDNVAGQISTYIRKLQPQVVLTFDPIGGYKHPDHIKVQRATLKAVQMAAEPQGQPQVTAHQVSKLYYHVIPKKMLRLAVRVLPLIGFDPHTFGRNHDIDLVEIIQEGDFPIHAVIDISGVFDKKDQAAACHKSQLDGSMPRRGLLGWIMRRLGRKEHFMRVHPPADPDLHETDLFAGIS